MLTPVADGLLEEMLQQAAVEGLVLGEQHVLQEVVALLQLIPEKQVALRLFVFWAGANRGAHDV